MLAGKSVRLGARRVGRVKNERAVGDELTTILKNNKQAWKEYLVAGSSPARIIDRRLHRMRQARIGRNDQEK